MDRITEPDAIQREFSALVPDIILASSSPNRRKLLEAALRIHDVLITLFDLVENQRVDSLRANARRRFVRKNFIGFVAEANHAGFGSYEVHAHEENGARRRVLLLESIVVAVR